jgi:uncharacterized protein YbaA (DUF1428 family)
MAQHGALEYRECTGDDLDVKCGFVCSVIKEAEAGRTVLFSWIVYKSRAHPDQVNTKVMKDRAWQRWRISQCPSISSMVNGGFNLVDA